MSMIKNSFKHFKKICKHKYYVGKYCFHYGLYKQGLMHDLSKFSPTEFFESVKYYQGDRSPIDACKEQNGYSEAWLHHKGRNKHHYEYWFDNLDNGGKPLLMPFNYMVEMFCDYIGAGQAYMGKNFTIESENGLTLGNLPADLCNTLAPLYDSGYATILTSTVSYIEKLRERSRYAKQAVLFVELCVKLT